MLDTTTTKSSGLRHILTSILVGATLLTTGCDMSMGWQVEKCTQTGLLAYGNNREGVELKKLEHQLRINCLKATSGER